MNSIIKYKSYLSDYLMKYHDVKNLNNFFHCLNPNHVDKNPSMRFTSKYNICHCFSCSANYDIFDLVGIDFHINNFKDQIAKVEELYSKYISENNNEKQEVIDNTIYDYTNYYTKCIRNINKSNYLEKRGITQSLIKKYKIGYDDRRKLIVFPINQNCYFARSTINNDKIKSKGSSDIWNKRHLYNSNKDDIVFVTEGIIDALSLETIDCNIKVVSINGVGNIKSLIRTIQDSSFSGTIIISFDNDTAGINATKELEDELKKIKVNCFSTTLVSNFDNDVCKDINKALTLDRKLLEKNYHYFREAFTKYIESQKIKIGDDSYCV